MKGILRSIVPSVWRKLRFGAPPQSAVVVFDAKGHEWLQRAVFDGVPHAVLHTRRERYFIGGRVLLAMLRNVRHIDPAALRCLRHGRVRPLFGELYRLHLLACLQCMKPRVVVTLIRNSSLFHWAGRVCRGPDFFAIQNAIDARRNVTRDVQRAGPICIPEFFCFGAFTADLYRAHGQQVQRYHVVGSMKGDFYRATRVVKDPPLEYDLCLVSQWRLNFITGQDNRHPEIARSLGRLDEFLSRYLRERELRACVAACSNQPAELEYLRNRYGQRATIVPRNDQALSTYNLMDRSRVLVGFVSTALFEGYAWGKKMLACNLFALEDYDFPLHELCWLAQDDYDLFRSRLDTLLAMDQAEFERRTRDNAHYIVHYDPQRPAHVAIREELLRRAGLGAAAAQSPHA